MRSAGFRRHQERRHLRRRLQEDRNQHYSDLDCSCWTDPKAIARFKEQPKRCSCWMCGNQRKHHGRTVAEKRAIQRDRY